MRAIVRGKASRPTDGDPEKGGLPGPYGLHRHSLGWVCAREDDRLVGFVDVAWDGGVHAFVLDTVVAQRNRSHGVGAALVRAAADGSRAAGREWLHVDFEEHLRSFYFEVCGFKETAAGLIAL
ncbi:GNAT family N-acetyltransferase [Streptomyces sp. NPDC051001]|uniref:GNAT family N-acetyltransferase n=1 Tax=Streptomyces sp. NPDC051001 TaxID=3155795 RepID=UPI0034294146